MSRKKNRKRLTAFSRDSFRKQPRLAIGFCEKNISSWILKKFEVRYVKSSYL